MINTDGADAITQVLNIDEQTRTKWQDRTGDVCLKYFGDSRGAALALAGVLRNEYAPQLRDDLKPSPEWVKIAEHMVAEWIRHAEYDA